MSNEAILWMEAFKNAGCAWLSESLTSLSWASIVARDMPNFLNTASCTLFVWTKKNRQLSMSITAINRHIKTISLVRILIIWLQTSEYYSVKTFFYKFLK